MAKDIDLKIKSIVAELSEVNSRNEQKVVAIASWNGLPDSVDIRTYNVKDDVLLKGIKLTFDEATEMVYKMVASQEIPLDLEKLKDLIAKREATIVDISNLAESLDDDDVNELDADTDDDTMNEESQRTIQSAINGYGRLTPKKKFVKRIHKSGLNLFN